MESLLLPVAPWMIGVAVFLTFLSAALQGTIGFGFAILSVPILSLIDPRLAPVPQVLVMLPMTLAMLLRERSHMDLKGVGWVLLGRIPGALLGLLLLKLAPPKVLSAILAGIVLLAVGLLLTRRSFKRSRGVDFGAGIASGTMSLVSSIDGPPVALLFRSESGPTLRASLAAIFTVGLGITLATRALAGEIATSDVVLAAYMLPGLFLGLGLSQVLKGKVEGQPLRIAILVVAAVSALSLLVKLALS